MDPAWDYDTLRAWFFQRLGQDVIETDLLRTFFPGEEAFAGVNLDLFHRHFLLYRRLWLFDDELRISSGHRLWIRGIRSTLLEPPAEGHCSWLNEETGRFCHAPTQELLCPQHSGTVPETVSMKTYYLDWSNLTGMTEEGLQTLVAGFFQWMGRQGPTREALQVLGLPEDATPQAIKARWRRLSLDHHPDRGGDAQRFQRLSAAWSVLKPLV